MSSSWWLALACIVSSACKPVALGDGEKRVVVREIAEQVILPTLEELHAGTDSLDGTIQALAGEPTMETLAVAQEAWRTARRSWKECEAFGFGPAMDLRLSVAIDQSPADRARIEAEIAGTAALSADHVEMLGANRKGFHAIEMLLFDYGDDSSVLASLSGDSAERRRDFLVALAANLHRKTGELRDAWVDSYAETLTQPGSQNDDFPTIKVVIDTIVNESVFLSELIADAKLGRPLGTASGGTPDPTLEESGPSDNSVPDMLANLRSIRSVYAGAREPGSGMGIGQLVAAQSSATHRAVVEAIEQAIVALEAIPLPYRVALVEHRPAVQSAREAVRALKHMLATEVVAVLGATLRFNDNDGD